MRTLGSLRSGGYGRVIAEFGRKAGQTFLSSFAPRGGGSNHHLGDDSVAWTSVSSMSCMDLTRSDGDTALTLAEGGVAELPSGKLSVYGFQ